MSVSIDQFKTVEMRVGLVVEAEDVVESGKLIKLKVKFGDDEIRTIFTGVRPFGYTPEYFLNKKWVFVTNLVPRKMMGEESQGMILAVDGPDGKPVFLETAEDVAVGAKVR